MGKVSNTPVLQISITPASYVIKPVSQQIVGYLQNLFGHY